MDLACRDLSPFLCPVNLLTIACRPSMPWFTSLSRAHSSICLLSDVRLLPVLVLLLPCVSFAWTFSGQRTLLIKLWLCRERICIRRCTLGSLWSHGCLFGDPNRIGCWASLLPRALSNGQERSCKALLDHCSLHLWTLWRIHDLCSGMAYRKQGFGYV